MTEHSPALVGTCV